MAVDVALSPSPLSAPYFAAALIAAAMATAILFDGRAGARRSFVWLLLSIAGVLIGTGIVHLAAEARVAAQAVRISQAIAALVPAIAIDFAAAIAGQSRPRIGRIAWLLGVVVAIVAISTPWVISGARVGPFGYAGRPGPAFPAVLLVMSFSTAVPILLVRARARERRPLAREQITLVLVSSVFALFGLVDMLPLLGVDVPPLGWLPLGCAAIGLLLAMVRHRLLHVRVALLRVGLWVALTLVGAVPFLAVGMVLHKRLHEMPLAASLASVAALVAAMRLYLVSVQTRIDALVGRRRHDIDLDLERLRAATGRAPDVGAIGAAVDEFLVTLERRLAALVVIDERGQPRVARSAWGSVPAPPAGSPLFDEMLAGPSLVWREQLRADSQLEVERAFVRWGAEYLAPLVEDGVLLGVVAVAPRRAGGVAGVLELEALSRMAALVAGALRDVRLYERLAALSAELEDKAAARGAALGRTLADLRGAEARLVEQEKLASLGQIVGGVASELSREVEAVFSLVARMRHDAERVFEEAQSRAAGGLPEVRADAGEVLAAITEGARRAYAIGAELARLAPPDNNVQPARPREEAQLAVLADATLGLVTRHLDDVAVIRDYDPTLPPVSVEVGPLGQVILNLLVNAVEAMGRSGTLVLGTRRTDNFVELSVADSGPGIPAEVLPRIFEAFFSTKSSSAGSGLGLAVSYAIVHRHGGDIVVESQAGQGSTFRVRLPLAAG
jgi:signal transduction histidine kinase